MHSDAPFNRLKDCRHGRMLYNVNDIYIGRSLELYGEYSEGEMEILRQVLRPGDVVMDIGANIGTHTVFFARVVGPGGAVLAFEPQRLVFQTLCANVALNSLVNVWCHNAAIGENTGTIIVPTLDPWTPNNFGGLALGMHPAGDPVPLLRADSIPLPRCRLMKIDVEGMELPVLRGAAGIIERHKPILYVENDRAERSRELVRHIASLGYELYWHTPPLFNPSNYLRNPTNVFGDTASFNMLCVHRSLKHDLRGFRPVEVPSP